MLHPATAAALTWAAATPAAMALPHAVEADPFSRRGALLPLALGGLLIATVLAIALLAALVTGGTRGARPGWRGRAAARPDILAGISAGLFAAWVALLLTTGLNGSPFGYAGLGTDQVRMSAMATRYSATLAPTDGIVAGVPGEYPPLFPWLVGRAAILLDVPAWRLLAGAQTLAVSLSVLLTFVLWRRLLYAGLRFAGTAPRDGAAGPRRATAALTALAIAALSLLAFGDPRKAHEVIALALFLPWVPAALGPALGPAAARSAALEPAALEPAAPRAARLHWLPAGLVGGVFLTSYLGFAMWGAPGMLAYVLLTFRSEPDRRAYLMHLLKTVAVALAAASWYLGPYAWTLARHGGQMVSDLFAAPAITRNPFPFLSTGLLGTSQLIGVLGVLWYRRTWWGTPLLCLVASAYLYRAVTMAQYVVTGHTGLFYHTNRLIGVTLAAAGVLTTAETITALARRLPAQRKSPDNAGAENAEAGNSASGKAASAPAIPAGTGVIAVALLVASCGFLYWQTSFPLPTGTDPTGYARLAHMEPLPDGRRTAYLPGPPVTRWFPVTPIRQAVTTALGPAAAPRTLSYDERLFSYLPWPGYIAVDRTAASSTIRWDDRHAALTRLAAVTDPAAFAQASAHTEFGGIDLFVLRRSGTAWTWRDIRFTQSQFDPASFTVVTGLPENTVLAIRRA